MEPNQIHQTIAAQLDSVRPDHFKPAVDAFMRIVDDATVRIGVPHLDRIVDVRYDPGGDHYDVTIVSPETEAERITGAYCDQLGRLVWGELAKPWSLPFGGIVDMDTGETIAEW
jgi:hypothetical protein